MMKQKLSIKENIFIGSMLFGLFFGAGNLIFPIHLGQTAGGFQKQPIKLHFHHLFRQVLEKLYYRYLVFYSFL